MNGKHERCKRRFHFRKKLSKERIAATESHAAGREPGSLSRHTKISERLAAKHASYKELFML